MTFVLAKIVATKFDRKFLGWVEWLSSCQSGITLRLKSDEARLYLDTLPTTKVEQILIFINSLVQKLKTLVRHGSKIEPKQKLLQ